jgi:23S rRNA (cytosine1962-C5)-methyltransferase
MPSIILKPGREKSVLRRHPWIFSGAIGGVEGNPSLGETVEVQTSAGQPLGWAAFSPHSQIQARMWTFDPKATIDEAFFRQALTKAIEARRFLLDSGIISSDSLRLVHAESDGLPGFILDRYGEGLVMQVLSAGSECWRDTLSALAVELTGARWLYERSDVDARRLEGLEPRTGFAAGEIPPDEVQIHENGAKLWVGIRQGHKTGYYLDQRENRLKVKQLAAGRDVLDCFSYTGSFAISVGLGGATSVLCVDSSADAIKASQRNVQLNALDLARFDWLEADVFQALRTFRDSRRSFDLIILDPPKFAQTASQAERASRAYKDINLLAFKLLRPGGLLVTFSCSGGIDEDLFQKIVAGSALDAGVDAQILERLHQGPDHPVALNFPEGAYLKGFICRIR